MSDQFDPYYTWLGIPPEEQPADYYRLLGVRRFETNDEVIVNAADQRMAYLRTFQVGKRSQESQRLLNEISTAQGCLRDPAKKQAYDAELRRRIEGQSKPAAASTPVIALPQSAPAQSATKQPLEPAAALLNRPIAPAAAQISVVAVAMPSSLLPEPTFVEPAPKIQSTPSVPSQPLRPVVRPQLGRLLSYVVVGAATILGMAVASGVLIWAATRPATSVAETENSLTEPGDRPRGSSPRATPPPLSAEALPPLLSTAAPQSVRREQMVGAIAGAGGTTRQVRFSYGGALVSSSQPAGTSGKLSVGAVLDDVDEVFTATGSALALAPSGSQFAYAAPLPGVQPKSQITIHSLDWDINRQVKLALVAKLEIEGYVGSLLYAKGGNRLVVATKQPDSVWACSIVGRKLKEQVTTSLRGEELTVDSFGFDHLLFSLSARRIEIVPTTGGKGQLIWSPPKLSFFRPVRWNDRSMVMLADPGRIRYWDVQSNRLAAEFAMPSQIGALDLLASSFDGEYLVVRQQDKVVVWDVPRQHSVAQIDFPWTVAGGANIAGGYGKLAVSIYDPQNSLVVLDLRKMKSAIHWRWDSLSTSELAEMRAPPPSAANPAAPLATVPADSAP